MSDEAKDNVLFVALVVGLGSVAGIVAWVVFRSLGGG